MHRVPLFGLDELDGSRARISPHQYLENDDIVLIRSNGNRELVGRSLIYRGPSCSVAFSGFCIRARVDTTKVNAKFIHYWLRSPRTRAIFTREGTGTGIYNLSQDFLAKMEVLLPPLSEQSEIAAALGRLDDKIELNDQMNETLRAMAQAIFRDWFVGFGPVRRKLAGAIDPVEILGNVVPDPHRAREILIAFPDAIADEKIPLGWQYRPLDQVADFLNGLALQKYPAGEGEPSLAVIKIAELRNGLSERSNRASRKVPARYLVRDGDFLFSWSGSLMAKVWTEGEGALNQHLFKVTSREYPQWFYAAWVNHHLAEFQSIAASKATTMGHIQRGHLSSAMTVCPPQDALDRLSEIMAPLWDRMIHNDLESRTLAETRDYLLPRLMSGELQVGGASQQDVAP